MSEAYPQVSVRKLIKWDGKLHVMRYIVQSHDRSCDQWPHPPWRSLPTSGCCCGRRRRTRTHQHACPQLPALWPSGDKWTVIMKNILNYRPLGKKDGEKYSQLSPSGKKGRWKVFSTITLWEKRTVKSILNYRPLGKKDGEKYSQLSPSGEKWTVIMKSILNYHPPGKNGRSQWKVF